MERIVEFQKLSGAELNSVKVVLADEATRLLHGADCLPGIHQAVQSLFTAQASSSESNVDGTSSANELESLMQVALSHEEFSTGQVSVVEMLVKSGFAASKNAARRLISQGGAQVNGVKVESDLAVVTATDFDAHGRLKLSGSKKKHVVMVRP